MSKERKALDDFIKDYLFLCEKLCTNKQEKMLLDSNSPYNVLKTYLESIDNANPSEALEYLEEIKNYFPFVDLGKGKEYVCEKEFNTIKQALLKAQEPKCYLKWEDLEFKEDGQETLVLLNDTKYRMYYYKGYGECINLFTEDEISVIHIFEGCSPQDKQFFNDLHLERVEE